MERSYTEEAEQAKAEGGPLQNAPEKHRQRCSPRKV
jgi:hypothetical protein